MSSIPNLVRHLHTLHDITRKSESVVNFGDIGPVKRQTAVNQLKPVLLNVAIKENWTEVITAISLGDKAWGGQFSEHLIESASGYYPGADLGTTHHLELSLWVDLDSQSTLDEKRLVLCDKQSGRVSNLKWSAYQVLTSKNDIAAARFEIGMCRLVYDKSNPAASWDVEFEGSEGGAVYSVRHFNTYVSPPWARLPLLEGIDISKPPQEIQEFFEHLFDGDQNQIDWMYGWSHYAQTSRAPTCPILSGLKGTGKSIWNHVTAALFTKSRPAPKNIFETSFNAPFLIDNEYCPIDEYPGDLLAIRKYMSKTQMLERKGVDSALADIHTNFSITGNPENVLHLHPDERIFSVMDITEKDLRTVWSEVRIKAFVEAFNYTSTDRIKAHWFHFIRNYSPKYSAAHVWKGPRFAELVIEGLPEWQSFLREECLRTLERTGPGGELLITKLRKDYREKRQIVGSGGSLFSKDKTARFLLKMAETGDILGTFVSEPKQHIKVGIDPRADSDIGLL